MAITLIDPEAIPLTHSDFKNWMRGAGFKIEELAEEDTNIWLRYYLTLDDKARDAELHNLKWDILGLKFAMAATMHLWRQLHHEMD